MPKPGGTGRGTVSGAAPGSKVASRSLDRFTVELRVDLTPIQGEGEVNVSWGVPEHSNNFLDGCCRRQGQNPSVAEQQLSLGE